jgi:hypothetical protein
LLDESNVDSSRYFKRSNALRIKYEKLCKMRTNLMRSSSKREDAIRSYSEVLSARKADAAIAYDSVIEHEKHLVMLSADYLAFPTEEKMYDIKDRTEHLRRLKVILANKNRAVDNWLAKSESEIINSRASKMRSGYGKFKERLKMNIANRDASIQVKFELKDEDAAVEAAPLTPEDILGKEPEWKLNKAVSHVSLDMLTKPEELESAKAYAVDVDSEFLKNQNVKKVDIADPDLSWDFGPVSEEREE